MTLTVPAGRSCRIEVPATSANLGPGFDCLGLALDWRDSCEVETVPRTESRPRVSVEITGEGAGSLPTDDRNLIADSLLRGLRSIGAELAPDAALRIRVHNTIPHGRGLGSSSAAIVAGLAGAYGLSRPGVPFEPADWLPEADRIEGHPDNVAAALYGGLVLAFRPLASAAGGPGRGNAVDPGKSLASGKSLDAGNSLDPARVAATVAPVHPAVRTLVLVPQTPLATSVARSVLPDHIPHADAAANAGRAALLIHALANDPDLLFEATADWLHQGYRAAAMPQTSGLLETLRAQGIPAVVSGAGPTVLVLGDADQVEAAEGLAPAGFQPVRVAIADGVRIVEPQQAAR